MQTILLFGAGKSATVLIEYLKRLVQEINGRLLAVDADIALVQRKLGSAPGCEALSFNISDGEKRSQTVAKADLVVSLLPPALHVLVAKDCIRHRKHLLTASYVDGEMKKLEKYVLQNDLLFLCEMGLDPGIDHMSAKKLLDNIAADGGCVTSFISHCGGLVAPESNDNPWHYKISWNPKNVVLAGKAGAQFLEGGQQVEMPYEKIFANKRLAQINGLGSFAWYPNRDSLSYKTMYGLEDCKTFIRTTLRHPDFITGWRNIVNAGLTDETVQWDTEKESIPAIIQKIMASKNTNEAVEKMYEVTRQLTKWLEVQKANTPQTQTFSKPHAQLQLIKEKTSEAFEEMQALIKEATTFSEQFHFLGLDDAAFTIPFSPASAADILQAALEKKLVLQPHDKDMVVMQHEIEYRRGHGLLKKWSTLIVKGENSEHTAMAKTVGLPLGIAAKLILQGKIQLRGLHIPTAKALYVPVLEELEANGICFIEKTEGFA